MAASPRGTDPSLEKELLARGHEFSFLQATRLLSTFMPKERGAAERIRFRPQLALFFPPADIARIEKDPSGYRVTVSFLGLLGPASPLPTFYSEDALESAGETSLTSDFLDIFHHRLFTLFCRCKVKYRLFFQQSRDERERFFCRLFSLIGLEDAALRRDLPNAQSLLRYSGILSLPMRSALGLETMLRDELGVPVKVVQCVKRRAQLPPAQRLKLGSSCARLGIDAVVGGEVVDVAAMVRLLIGPLDREAFSSYLPDSPGRSRIDRLTKLYLGGEFLWDLQLVHRCDDVPNVALGAGSGARLGCDSWLSPGAFSGHPLALFKGG